uniref:dual specificity tyrosine-phosphorylation-regulated kinase 4-like n=1 Tax=Styela clava TaxID=7725 RepID=UPI00193ADF24|nr:dual specificity tyrosine-phosphorylation-regulated kinase 4-like [Styela clava]
MVRLRRRFKLFCTIFMCASVITCYRSVYNKLQNKNSKLRELSVEYNDNDVLFNLLRDNDGSERQLSSGLTNKVSFGLFNEVMSDDETNSLAVKFKTFVAGDNVVGGNKAIVNKYTGTKSLQLKSEKAGTGYFELPVLREARSTISLYQSENTPSFATSLQNENYSSAKVKEVEDFRMKELDQILMSENIQPTIEVGKETSPATSFSGDNAKTHDQRMEIENNTESQQFYDITLQDDNHELEYQKQKSVTFKNDEITQIFPLTPEDAIQIFGEKLNDWEQREIRNYSTIWYLGLEANKTRPHQNSVSNYGFDYSNNGNENKHYKVILGDHIAYRYEILRLLGMGAEGTTVEAIDHSNNERVAIKIVINSEWGKSVTGKEINMMKCIEKFATNLDYFSRLIDSFRFRNHRCLVLELLGSSLEQDLPHYPIKDANIMKRVAKDIFHAMFYLHELGIVHMDLKPDNILYMYGKNRQSKGQLVKVVDFAISCIPDSKSELKCPDHHLQPYYYRSPEDMLYLPFTTQCDIFSVGTILAELFLGVPAIAGRDEIDQFVATIGILGLPPAHMLINAKSPIFIEAMNYVRQNQFRFKKLTKSLQTTLKGMDPLLFDLISKCLEWDPALRITAVEALQHPYFQ